MRQILKQTSWLILAQVLTKVIGFFYTIFLAKSLGVSDFGLLSFVLAQFSLTAAVADFGFNRYLVREIAQDKSKITGLFCSISLLRLTIGSMVFALFAVVLYFLDPDKLRVHLTALTILAILPQALAQTIDGIFVGLQKLSYSALGLLATSLFTAIFGITLVSLGFGSTGAVVGLITGQIIYYLLLLFYLKKLKIPLVCRISDPLFKKVIYGSLPYGILTILGIIYFRADIFLLTYLKGNFDTGIYSAGYKFLEVSILIPSSLGTVFFPLLANLESRKILKQLRKTILLTLVLSIIIALAYITLLPIAVKLFLTQYTQSIGVVKILALSIPFFFINALQSALLLSQRRFLNSLIIISVLVISLNIILNLILIPKFTYLGAAWVTVITEFLVSLIFFIIIKKNFS